MSAHWLRQRERGSKLLLSLFVTVTRALGRPVGRVLLYPICLYFVLFSRQAARASRLYLTKVMAQPVGMREIFNHYYCFACVALDRIFLLTGRYQNLDVKVHNPEALLRYLDHNQACILLGGHIGSFEVMRVLGGDRGLAIRILMYEENAAKVRDVINCLNPELAQRVIAIGEPETLLKVKEAADQGELIGILGDRVRAGDKSITCNFLGAPAAFPAGPLMLASVLKLPVVFGVALYRGRNCYEIFFEELDPCVILSREHRTEELTLLMQRYVDRLDYYCRLAPYNWFNFYNVWENAHEIPTQLLHGSGSVAADDGAGGG